MTADPTFSVEAPTEPVRGKSLIAGVSNVGMVGLTAADYLVRYLESEQIGHVSAHDLPDITPFSNGELRYPIRLYDVPERDVCVLLSEVFVPVWAADPFADALLEWAGDAGVGEMTMLHGVPFPHGPEEHRVFGVSTPEYRSRRFRNAETEVPPLGGGFFDGVLGELTVRSLGGETPPIGVLVTPGHPPGPDFAAARLLLDTLQSLYGFTVDQSELEQLSEEMQQYYTELADRMKTLQEADEPHGSRYDPEDRMYM